MRLWTLLFLGVATIAGLATRHDTGPLLLLSARIGFVLLVGLCLLAGIRALTLQMSDPMRFAWPRAALRSSRRTERGRPGPAQLARAVGAQPVTRHAAHPAAPARHRELYEAGPTAPTADGSAGVPALAPCRDAPLRGEFEQRAPGPQGQAGPFGSDKSLREPLCQRIADDPDRAARARATLPILEHHLDILVGLRKPGVQRP